MFSICGSVGRAIASDTRDPWFDSIIGKILSTKMKMKSKEAENGPSLKKSSLIQLYQALPFEAFSILCLALKVISVNCQSSRFELMSKLFFATLPFANQTLQDIFCLCWHQQNWNGGFLWVKNSRKLKSNSWLLDDKATLLASETPACIWIFF